MWTYTALMLDTFLKGRTSNTDDGIGFTEFADFIFKRLFAQRGVVFHDTKDDLETDLVILSNLGVISYDKQNKKIRVGEDNLKLLEAIAQSLRENPLRKELMIVDEYVKRIEGTTSIE